MSCKKLQFLVRICVSSKKWHWHTKVTDRAYSEVKENDRVERLGQDLAQGYVWGLNVGFCIPIWVSGDCVSEAGEGFHSAPQSTWLVSGLTSDENCIPLPREFQYSNVILNLLKTCTGQLR